jgi:pyruvyltransferase
MYPSVVPAFWSKENNFGDYLTKALLASYGIVSRYARPSFAQIVGVGSILERVPDQFPGIVLGTGFAWEVSRSGLRQARVLALRGPLTRARISAAKPLLLGDPGLLAPRLLGSRPPPRYRLGLVPHYVDQQNAMFSRLRGQHPDEVTLIDVRRQPGAVIREIAECEAIVSSSLHGLIVADALGIPSAWHYVPAVLGAGFKFQDHFAAICHTRSAMVFQGGESLPDLLRMTSPPPPRAETVGAELNDLFRELPIHLDRLEVSALDQWRLYLSAKLQRLVKRRRAA